jgi:hypothetical protein
MRDGCSTEQAGIAELELVASVTTMVAELSVAGFAVLGSELFLTS